ncbi:MAG: hypothetical protein IID45_14090, partial [Planctomycetes bacterium]|nr:hypothetical protein [Planctomycetota bacterium]
MADDDSPSIPDETVPAEDPSVKKTKKRSAFHFFLRGLAITLPPLLTIWILYWVAGVLNDVILNPASGAVRWCISWSTDDSRPEDQFESRQSWMPPLEYCETKYKYVVSPKTKETLEKDRNRERQACK